jgi:ubiquitin carboxyl-terminal hydrolase 36/42
MDKHMFSFKNIGNTCFMNTALQCLFRLPELNRVLDKAEVPRDEANPLCHFFHQWNDLRRLCLDNPGATVFPKLFLHEVQTFAAVKKMDTFCRRDQNDVAEFVQFLLASAHDAMAKSVNFDEVELDDPVALKCREAMKTLYGKQCSEIVLLFYGMQVTQINGTASVIAEPFLSLDLPIPARATSLQDCLAAYMEEEAVDGWLNEATGQVERASKVTTFFRTPSVLLIVLKRFDGFGRKNPQPIRVPEELEFGETYKLQSVAAHLGHAWHSGHYVAHCKVGDKWVTIDDDVSTPCADVSRDAYCVFYTAVVS